MKVKEEYWNKKEWAFHIGFFLMRIANIEESINKLKASLDTIKLLESPLLPTTISEPPKSWYKLKTNEQAAKLIRLLENTQLEKYAPAKLKKELIDLLSRLIAIKDTRNTIAHGTFALKDGHSPDTPNYCIFSRSQRNEQGEIVAESKVLHAKDMDSQFSEATHLEMGLTSCTRTLINDLNLQLPPTDELTFEQRAREADLSLLIGRFIVSMGEIENLLHLTYQTVLDPEYCEEQNSPIIKLMGYWDSLTLSRQVADLLDRLPLTAGYTELRKVILKIKDSELVDTRNLLCHAKIRHLRSPTSGQLELVASRNTGKSVETHSEEKVISSIRTSLELSDSLSEALSIARMSLVRPFKSR